MPEEPKTEEPQGQPPEITKEPEKKEESGEPQKQDFEKSYKELQSKFNQRDEEIKTARQEKEEALKNIENWKKLGAVIENDPELFGKVKEKLGVKEEAPANGKAQPDETKLFIRDNIIDKFEDRYRIRDLEPEKAQELRTKIGGQLQTMLDPQGTGKDLNDLMLEVPLNKLPMYFENAYKLATSDDTAEQSRLRGLAEASENNAGMIGSIPSSSAKGNLTPLTDKEKEAAKKLGISEKDYAEYKNK